MRNCIAALLIAAFGLAGLSCNEGVIDNVNHMPLILGVVVSPNPVVRGGSAVLLAEAVDEDGDGLRYFWTAEEGSFDAVTGESVTWNAPTFAGRYRVQLTVSDRSAAATSTIMVNVTAGQLGGDVRFESNPSLAEIVIDGRSTGIVTPHTFTSNPDDPTQPPDPLEVGEYVVSLEFPGRFLFPDTALIRVREGQDTTAVFNFVTTTNVGGMSAAIDAYPPQLSPDGFFVVWSDDRFGPFEVRQNGVNQSPDNFASPEPVGYDGEAYYPGWGVGGISRLMFQTSVADTGSRLYDYSIFGGVVRPFLLGGDARRARVATSGTQMAFVRHEREGSIYRTRLMRATNLVPTDVVTGTVVSLLEFTSASGRIEISTPVFSSTESWLVYSRREPDGREDIYLYDIALQLERRLTSTGTRSWPTLGTADRIVFYQELDPGAPNGSAGIYGAGLDRSAWRLGRPMRMGPAGARTPSFGRNASGTSKRLSYLTDVGVIICNRFSD